MLSTAPNPSLFVRLMRGRPLALLVTVERSDRTAVNITGCTLSLVIAKKRIGTVMLTAAAAIVDAASGQFEFDIDADELAFAPGTYDLGMTLTSAEGYASSIVGGEVELVHNPDGVVPVDHSAVVPAMGLTAILRKQNKVTIRVDHHPDSMLKAYADQAVQAAAEAGTLVVDASVAVTSAQQYATSAAASAIASGTAKDAAAASAAAAAASAADALQSETAANDSANAAALQVTAAQTAVTDAQAQATAAAGSATAAAGSATTASTQATSASDAATVAVGAATDAQTFRDNTAAIRDDLLAQGENAYVHQRHADAEHVHEIRVMTQAAYDALAPKVATTLYVIAG